MFYRRQKEFFENAASAFQTKTRGRRPAGQERIARRQTPPPARELFEMLAFQKQVRDQTRPERRWVFSRYGRRIKDFRGAWEGASKRASLWNTETGKPKHIFHDLRRTGARNLVRAGVPERVVMAIGGWKTRSVFDRYNIVSERDLHEAAENLETYLKRVASQHRRATKWQTPDLPDIIPP